MEEQLKLYKLHRKPDKTKIYATERHTIVEPTTEPTSEPIEKQTDIQHMIIFLKNENHNLHRKYHGHEKTTVTTEVPKERTTSRSVEEKRQWPLFKFDEDYGKLLNIPNLA